MTLLASSSSFCRPFSSARRPHRLNRHRSHRPSRRRLFCLTLTFCLLIFYHSTSSPTISPLILTSYYDSLLRLNRHRHPNRRRRRPSPSHQSLSLHHLSHRPSRRHPLLSIYDPFYRALVCCCFLLLLFSSNYLGP